MPSRPTAANGPLPVRVLVFVVLLVWVSAETAALAAGSAHPRPSRPKNGGLSELAIPGGAVELLVASPADPTRIWGINRTRFWRSDDNGRTWSRLVDVSPTARIVVADPQDRDVLWAADVEGKAIYRSSDGGASFVRRDDGSLDEPQMTAFAIDPLAPASLYVGGGHGIRASRDGGVSWTEAAAGPTYPHQLLADPSRAGRLWARSPAAPLARSDDGGLTWSALAVPFGDGRLLALDGAHPDRLLANGPTDPGGVERLWESLDAGATWRDLAPPTGGAPFTRLAVSEDGAAWVVTGARSQVSFRVLRRPYEGSWAVLPAPGGVWTTDLALAGADAMVATWAGVRRLGAAGWERPDREPDSQDVFQVAAVGTPPWVFAATPGGLWRGLVSGGPFEPVQPPGAADGIPIALSVLQGGYPPRVYLALGCVGDTRCLDGRHGRLYRSDCEGCDWQTADQGLPESISTLALSPVDPDDVWTIAGGEAWRSRDGGASWRRLAQGLMEGDVLGTLAIAPDDPSLVLLGTLNHGVYRWRKDTEAWEHQTSPGVLALALAPGGVAWAVASTVHTPSAILERSLDRGVTWSVVETPFAGNLMSVRGLATTRDAPGELWLTVHDFNAADGPRAGLWRTRDLGEHFTQFLARNDLSAVTTFQDARGVALITGGDGGLLRWIDPCEADGDTLCLLGGRMRVEGTWHNRYDGTSGTTLGQQQSDTTGVLAFRSLDNPELVVKAIDLGRPDPGLFVGQLTDLEWRVRITDTRTGASTLFTEYSEGCQPSEAVPITIPTGTCLPGADTVCLNDGRLRVRARWENPYDGSSGVAGSLPYSALARWLTFAGPSLPELLVKALDFGDRTLLFWGALTDLGYTLTVDDLAAGTSRSYVNPPRRRCGGFASW